MDLCELSVDALCRLFRFLSVEEVLLLRSLFPKVNPAVQLYMSTLNARLRLTYYKIGKYGSQKLQEILRDPNYYPYPAIDMQLEHDELFEIQMIEYGRRFGTNIERFKVERLDVDTLLGAKEFFGYLPNLKSLWIECLVIGENAFFEKEGKCDDSSTLPKDVFEQLEELRFNFSNDSFSIRYLLLNCPHLKRIHYGQIDRYGARLALHDLMNYLLSRQKAGIHTKLNLDIAELQLSIVSQQWIEFVRFLRRFDVDIENMASSWLDLTDERQISYEEMNNLMRRVQGVTGIGTQMFALNLQNLKNLKIDIYDRDVQLISSDFPTVSIKDKWPCLTVLNADIAVSQKLLLCQLSRRRLDNFLMYFFEKPTNIKELKIKISTSTTLPYMSPTLWVSFYQCLQRLELNISFYNQAEVTQLFYQLGTKTYICSLDLRLRTKLDCSTFIGSDTSQPVFLAMKRLQHFSVYVAKQDLRDKDTLGLAEREGVEHLFENVFSQSRLKCLDLRSDSKWCFPVTERCVNSMIKGAVGQQLRQFDYSYSYFDVDDYILPWHEREQNRFLAAVQKLSTIIKLNRTTRLSSILEINECGRCFCP